MNAIAICARIRAGVELQWLCRQHPGDDRLGGKQAGLVALFNVGLEDLAQFLEAAEFVVVARDPDMADDALPDFVGAAYSLDELDGAAGTVGSGFDANEHGG